MEQEIHWTHSWQEIGMLNGLHNNTSNDKNTTIIDIQWILMSFSHYHEKLGHSVPISSSQSTKSEWYSVVHVLLLHVVRK